MQQQECRMESGIGNRNPKEEYITGFQKQESETGIPKTYIHNQDWEQEFEMGIIITNKRKQENDNPKPESGTIYKNNNTGIIIQNTNPETGIQKQECNNGNAEGNPKTGT